MHLHKLYYTLYHTLYQTLTILYIIHQSPEKKRLVERRIIKATLKPENSFKQTQKK